MTDLAAQIHAALDRAEETAQADGVDWNDDDQDYADALAAENLHKRQPHGSECAWRMGEMNDPCTCGYPAHVLRLCAALREVVKLHAGEDDPCPHDYGPFVLREGPIEVGRDSRGWPVTSRPIGYQEDLGCPTLAALASVWDVPGVAE